MVEIFPSETMTPEQVLLSVEKLAEEMDCVAIAWLDKEGLPMLTCSSMNPTELNYLGVVVQHHSLRYLKE